jgi:hypothetical protein
MAIGIIQNTNILKLNEILLDDFFIKYNSQFYFEIDLYFNIDTLQVYNQSTSGIQMYLENSLNTNLTKLNLLNTSTDYQKPSFSTIQIDYKGKNNKMTFYSNSQILPYSYYAYLKINEGLYPLQRFINDNRLIIVPNFNINLNNNDTTLDLFKNDTINITSTYNYIREGEYLQYVCGTNFVQSSTSANINNYVFQTNPIFDYNRGYTNRNSTASFSITKQYNSVNKVQYTDNKGSKIQYCNSYGTFDIKSYNSIYVSESDINNKFTLPYSNKINFVIPYAYGNMNVSINSPNNGSLQLPISINTNSTSFINNSADIYFNYDEIYPNTYNDRINQSSTFGIGGSIRFYNNSIDIYRPISISRNKIDGFNITFPNVPSVLTYGDVIDYYTGTPSDNWLVNSNGIINNSTCFIVNGTENGFLNLYFRDDNFFNGTNSLNNFKIINYIQMLNVPTSLNYGESISYVNGTQGNSYSYMYSGLTNNSTSFIASGINGTGFLILTNRDNINDYITFNFNINKYIQKLNIPSNLNYNDTIPYLDGTQGNSYLYNYSGLTDNSTSFIVSGTNGTGFLNLYNNGTNGTNFMNKFSIAYPKYIQFLTIPDSVPFGYVTTYNKGTTGNSYQYNYSGLTDNSTSFIVSGTNGTGFLNLYNNGTSFNNPFTIRS